MDAFLESALSNATTLYQNTHFGTLLINLLEFHPKECGDVRPIALVTEHRPFESQQQRLQFIGRQASVQLPTGQYTVLVSYKGMTPFRTVVAVTPNATTVVEANLSTPATPSPSIEEVLKRNFVDRSVFSLRNLNVHRGERLRLDPYSDKYPDDLSRVPLRSLSQVKQALGVADQHFSGDTPRFGNFSLSRQVNAPSGTLNLAQRAALNEYIYGNSRSVANWTAALNKWIGAEEFVWPIWAFLDINVGRHAVLEVTSSGLICNTLSVHYTGLVRFVGPGPIRVEVNNYVLYGFDTIKGPTNFE